MTMVKPLAHYRHSRQAPGCSARGTELRNQAELDKGDVRSGEGTRSYFLPPGLG